MRKIIALLLVLAITPAAWSIERNVASQKLKLFAFDYTTGAPKTGDAANLTAYVSIDGDTSPDALGDTIATELSSTDAPGWYQFDLTQGETNGISILYSAKSSTANVVVRGVDVSTTPSGWSAGTSNVNVQTVTTDAISADAIAPDAIGASEVAAGAIGASEIASDAIGSNEIAADAIGASEVAASALTKGTEIAGFNDLDAAGVRTAVGLASANLDTQLSTIETVVDATNAVTDKFTAAGVEETGTPAVTDTPLEQLQRLFQMAILGFEANATEKQFKDSGGAVEWVKPATFGSGAYTEGTAEAP